MAGEQENTSEQGMARELDLSPDISQTPTEITPASETIRSEEDLRIIGRIAELSELALKTVEPGNPGDESTTELSGTLHFKQELNGGFSADYDPNSDDNRDVFRDADDYSVNVTTFRAGYGQMELQHRLPTQYSAQLPSQRERRETLGIMSVFFAYEPPSNYSALDVHYHLQNQGENGDTQDNKRGLLAVHIDNGQISREWVDDWPGGVNLNANAPAFAKIVNFGLDLTQVLLEEVARSQHSSSRQPQSHSEVPQVQPPKEGRLASIRHTLRSLRGKS